MENKQTAVETLIEIYYGNEGQLTIKDLEQAKEMEKQQIEDSYKLGYYNHFQEKFNP